MSDYSLQPDFVEGTAGQLFALDAIPKSEIRGQALYLPPHGEELNRCRAVISAHARAFASNHTFCRVLDYYGSGDSSGEFNEGHWPIWQHDIKAQIASLKSKNDVPIILIGFRLGALCALDFINQNPGLVEGLVLIQPVTQGKQYVTQLLRQRIASQINSEQNTETTKQIRESLTAGNDIEIGGYEFGSDLLMELDQQTIDDKTQVSNLDIHWLEYVSEEGKDVTPASNKAISKLRELSNQVVVHTFCDPPIWQLHEREEANKSVEMIGRLELWDS